MLKPIVVHLHIMITQIKEIRFVSSQIYMIVCSDYSYKICLIKFWTSQLVKKKKDHFSSLVKFLAPIKDSLELFRAFQNNKRSVTQIMVRRNELRQKFITRRFRLGSRIQCRDLLIKEPKFTLSISLPTFLVLVKA